MALFNFNSLPQTYSYRYCLVTLWLLASNHVVSSAPVASGKSKHPHTRNALLEHILLAVDKLIAFYDMKLENFNLDGLLGIRIIEGQLDLVKKWKAGGLINGIDSSILRRLDTLHHFASTVGKRVEALLSRKIREGDEYVQAMKPTVDSPWTFYMNTDALDISLRLPAEDWYGTVNEDDFNEDKSDNCMSELFGTEKHGHGKRCFVSTECMDMVLKKGFTSYALTHQLLYTVLAIKGGCERELRAALKTRGHTDLQRLWNAWCANIYTEMLVNTHRHGGLVVPRVQDLLLEQIFVCGSVGYREVLNPDWLMQLLSWQQPGGCYGKMPAVIHDQGHPDDYEYLSDHTEANRAEDSVINPVMPQYADLKGEIRHFVDPQLTGGRRRLLVEIDMQDNCLSHKTATACGAIMQYVLYLFRPSGTWTWHVDYKALTEELRPYSVKMYGELPKDLTFQPAALVLNKQLFDSTSEHLAASSRDKLFKLLIILLLLLFLLILNRTMHRFRWYYRVKRLLLSR